MPGKRKYLFHLTKIYIFAVWSINTLNLLCIVCCCCIDLYFIL